MDLGRGQNFAHAYRFFFFYQGNAVASYHNVITNLSSTIIPRYVNCKAKAIALIVVTVMS